jgi:PAS domain S-box-containing protein
VALQAFPLREDIASVAAELARKLDAAHAVLALDAARFGVAGVGSPGLPRAVVEALGAPGEPVTDAVVVRDFAASSVHAPVAQVLADLGIVATVRLPLRGRVGTIGSAELLYKTEPALDEVARLKRLLLGEHAAMNVVTMRLFSLVERAKREWEVTFDAIRDGIMVLDRDCRIRRANWGMGIMLGTTPSLLVGKTCHESVFARPAPCTHCPLVPHGAARPFKAHECEDVIDGRAVQVAMYPLIAEDGSLSGLVSIVRDISERKKEEREFRLMHEELVRAHGTLQGSVEQLKAAQTQLVQSEKMAAVGQLISGVAHELNNPLTGIIGYTQLLQDTDDVSSIPPEKLQKYVRYMGREAARCQKIVQNLLTFARRNEPEKRAVDLNDIVRRTIELKAYDLRVNDIAVHQDLAASLPATMADAHQLQQVLLNVLVNAQQAIRGGAGRGSIHVRTRVSARPEAVPRPEHDAARWLVVEIEDDGPGFDDEVKARLFDPFFTTKEVGQGTGLGLSICYGIVKEHLGYITAHRAPGGGALFRLELPVMEPRDRKKPVRDAGQPAAPAPPGRRILVIDDEATICDMVRDILQLDGHLVDTARNGQAGLVALKQERYDCVLADLKMPEVDGMTLHATLLERDPEAASRMIFMTGDMLSESSRAFLERTGNPYLAKPFSIQDLRSRIASILADAR